MAFVQDNSGRRICHKCYDLNCRMPWFDKFDREQYPEVILREERRCEARQKARLEFEKAKLAKNNKSGER